MNIYFAPLEGVGGYIFRNAHKDYFKHVDKYFSPFVAARASGIMKKKELKDILPENNDGINLVPQLIFVYLCNNYNLKGASAPVNL